MSSLVIVQRRSRASIQAPAISITRGHLLTAILLSLGIAGALAGCGGGGSSSPTGQSSSGDSPAQPGAGSGDTGVGTGTGTGSTTPPVAPPAPTTFPLMSGRHWSYHLKIDNSVVSGTGISTYSFDGERLLATESEGVFQGQNAWELTQYDRPAAPVDASGYTKTIFYLYQDSTGLHKWVDTADGGLWKQVFSADMTPVTGGTFMMAGGPAKGTESDESAPIPITVPFGTFQSLLLSHTYNISGQYQPADIAESRSEYYADQVGLAKATWNYSYDDNDPAATDTSSRGSIDLVSADVGANVLAEIEPNDNSGDGVAQVMAVGDIVTGQVQDTDAGLLTLDTSVAESKAGHRLLQDWYRFETSVPGTAHIVLKYAPKSTGGVLDDLDLYLFQVGPNGERTFINRSVHDPATAAGANGEWIHEDTLPAGTYFVAIQAWNTPSGAVDYWLSIQ